MAQVTTGVPRGLRASGAAVASSMRRDLHSNNKATPKATIAARQPRSLRIPSRQLSVMAASESVTGPTKPSQSAAQSTEEEEEVPQEQGEDADGLKMESWGQAVMAMNEKKDVTILLTRYNNSGFNCKSFGLTGFIPYSLMDPTTLPAKGDKDANDKRRELLGKHKTARVVEAEISGQRLIFSEVAAMGDKLLEGIKVGEVRTGVVRTVTDFGAFVDLMENGEVTGAAGLVHKSELSWGEVTVTSSVVQPGMEVEVKVMSIDQIKGHISLSMKQCQDDPLLANLDTMLPVEEDPSVVWEESESMLPGLEEILKLLREDDGVLFVTPGRMAEVPRVVAQDLQIFMTKEQVTDGYNLVARLGTRVQEVHVATDLPRNDMVEVLTGSLRRLQK